MSFRLFMLSMLLVSCTGIDESQIRSQNFRDGTFHNSDASQPHHNLWDVISMRYSTDWAEWPEELESTTGEKPEVSAKNSELIITHINHSTFLLQSGGVNILTDPIYSERCSPVSFAGPKRIRKPAIDFNDLPKIDVILISHDHYDHLDLATLRRLVERDSPKMIMGLGVSQRLDFKADTTELDWWQNIELSKELNIHFVEVQHFSGRGLFDRFKTLWGGYVLVWNGKKIYFGGDTGFGDHFAKTFQKYGPMDVSLIPIGAYSPRWFMKFMHVDPQEAVRAHKILKSQVSIGMHYGTFQLTAEPHDEPPLKLNEAIKQHGLSAGEFLILKHGKSYKF